MKLYLAGPYRCKDEINVRAAELRTLGFTITSRWLEETHAPNVQLHEVTEEDKKTYALHDVQDIRTADVLVFFTDPTKTIVRGGRHVEFGIAIERLMPIVVIGEHENVFHYLPSIKHVENWEQAKNMLELLRSF